LLTSQLQKIKNTTNTFNKPHLSFEAQLEKLKNRGLCIHNEAFAIKKLSHINYYRLRAYFWLFQHPKDSPKKSLFLDNIEFRSIIRVYEFDAKLRRLLFGAIETIEVYVRTQIAFCHAKEYKAFGYLDKENLSCDELVFDELMQEIKKASKRSDELFIDHFQKQYNTTDLPIWAVVEILSFGTVSKLFNVLKTETKQEVIKDIPINIQVFQNWLHALTIVRNICAHHSRLWNKQLRIPFKIPSKNALFNPLRKIIKIVDIDGEKVENTYDNNTSVFFALSVMKFIFDSIGEEVIFKNELQELLNEYHEVDKIAMGFVDGWENLMIWDDV